MIKINKAAVNRLAAVLLKKHMLSIPTKEKYWWGDEEVHYIPTSSILRRTDHLNYKKMRGPHKIFGTPIYGENHKIVKRYRALIRAGKSHEMEPIHVVQIDPDNPNMDMSIYDFLKKKPHHQYMMVNGHHRLTAHQAEGKKLIKAYIRKTKGPPPIQFP